MTSVHRRTDLLRYKTPRLITYSVGGVVFYATRDGRYSITKVVGGYKVREKKDEKMVLVASFETLRECKDYCGVPVKEKPTTGARRKKL